MNNGCELNKGISLTTTLCELAGLYGPLAAKVAGTGVEVRHVQIVPIAIESFRLKGTIRSVCTPIVLIKAARFRVSSADIDVFRLTEFSDVGSEDNINTFISHVQLHTLFPQDLQIPIKLQDRQRGLRYLLLRQHTTYLPSRGDQILK